MDGKITKDQYWEINNQIDLICNKDKNNIINDEGEQMKIAKEVCDKLGYDFKAFEEFAKDPKNWGLNESGPKKINEVIGKEICADIQKMAQAYKVNVSKADIDEIGIGWAEDNVDTNRKTFKNYFNIPQDADENPDYAHHKDYDPKKFNESAGDGWDLTEDERKAIMSQVDDWLSENGTGNSEADTDKFREQCNEESMWSAVAKNTEDAFEYACQHVANISEGYKQKNINKPMKSGKMNEAKKNPEVDENGAKSVGVYKGNTIYDKGDKSKDKYRFYMRSEPIGDYDCGPITANGTTIEEAKKNFDEAEKTNEGAPGTNRLNEGLMGEAEAKYDLSKKELTFMDGENELAKFTGVDLDSDPEFTGEIDQAGTKYHFTLEKIDSGFRITIYGDKDGAPDPDNMEVVDQAETETVVNEADEPQTSKGKATITGSTGDPVEVSLEEFPTDKVEQLTAGIIAAVKTTYPELTDENITAIKSAISDNADTITLEIGDKKIAVWFTGISGETPDLGFGESTDGTMAGVDEDKKKKVTVEGVINEDMIMDELKNAQAEMAMVSSGSMLESRIPIYNPNPRLRNLNESNKRFGNVSEASVDLKKLTDAELSNKIKYLLKKQKATNLSKEDSKSLVALKKEKDSRKSKKVNESAGSGLSDQIFTFISNADGGVSPDAVEGQFPNSTTGEIADALAFLEKNGDVKVSNGMIVVGDVNESAGDTDVVCPSCGEKLGKDKLDVLRCYNKKCSEYGLTAQVDQPLDKPVNESIIASEWVKGPNILADMQLSMDITPIVSHMEKELGAKMTDISTTDSENSDFPEEIATLLSAGKVKASNQKNIEAEGFTVAFQTIDINGIKVVYGDGSGVTEAWVKTSDLPKLDKLDLFEAVTLVKRKVYEGLAPRMPGVEEFSKQEKAMNEVEEADVAGKMVTFPDDVADEALKGKTFTVQSCTPEGKCVLVDESGATVEANTADVNAYVTEPVNEAVPDGPNDYAKASDQRLEELLKISKTNNFTEEIKKIESEISKRSKSKVNEAFISEESATFKDALMEAKKLKGEETKPVNESEEDMNDLLAQMNKMVVDKYGKEAALTIDHKKAAAEIPGYQELYSKYADAGGPINEANTPKADDIVKRLEAELAKYKDDPNYEDDVTQQKIYDDILTSGIYDWESSHNAQAYAEKATPEEIVQYSLDRVKNGGAVPKQYEKFGADGVNEAFTAEESGAFSRARASAKVLKGEELTKSAITSLVNKFFPKESTPEAKAEAVTKICGLCGLKDVDGVNEAKEPDYGTVTSAIKDIFGIDPEDKNIHIDDLDEVIKKTGGSKNAIAKMLNDNDWAIEGYDINESAEADVKLEAGKTYTAADGGKLKIHEILKNGDISYLEDGAGGGTMSEATFRSALAPEKTNEAAGDGTNPADGKNGYVAFYKNQQKDIYADSSYQAQTKAAALFKAKKAYEVTVALAEKGGEQVTHAASESASDPKPTHVCSKDWEGECQKGDTGNYDAEEGVMTMLDGKNVGAPLVVTPEILAEYFGPVEKTNEGTQTCPVCKAQMPVGIGAECPKCGCVQTSRKDDNVNEAAEAGTSFTVHINYQTKDGEPETAKYTIEAKDEDEAIKLGEEKAKQEEDFMKIEGGDAVKN